MSNPVVVRNDEFIGICQKCGMYGVLKVKAVLDGECDAITGETPDASRLKRLCVTCFDTPTGMKSDNLRHKRLPDNEYK